MIRGIVFDLDDTLYLERDYVRSGFDHVARMLATPAHNAAALNAWLDAAFEAGVRGDTFNRLLIAYPELAPTTSVTELINAYRSHRPAIRLGTDTEGLLDRLRGQVRLGVLSDGPLASQQAKAQALGLERWFDPIVLTAARPGFAKPATAGFSWIASAWQLAAGELAYLADNPAKDFRGPRSLGWRTIRVRIPGQNTDHLEPATVDDRADVEVHGLAAAIDHLLD